MPRRPAARSSGTSRCSATTSATGLRNDDDSAANMQKSVVITPFFDWEGDRRLNIPYNESFIYEAHVKGLTQLHPDVPEDQRGTYAGLAHPAVTEHLTKLGVTAIELMPVHQFVQDSTLQEKGLRNYWGYNTLGFFAPHADYAANREAWPAGAGVQVDGQGHACRRHRGHPRRGLQPHRRRQPHGPDAEHARHRQRGVLPARRGRQAVLHGLHRHRQHPQRAPPALAAADHGLAALLGDRDARRRLPLRPRLPLAREFYDVDRLATFFELVQQDPVVSQVKLIAGDPGTSAPAATRSATSRPSGPSGTAPTATPCATSGAASRRSASSPRGSPSPRTSTSTPAAVRSRASTSSRPTTASRCATSFRPAKHNEANGEDNNDGENRNRSWNHGVEGPTDDSRSSKCGPASSAT